MAENFAFGGAGFAFIRDIVFGGGGHSDASFLFRSSAGDCRTGCGPTRVITAGGGLGSPSSSDTDGPRFREGGEGSRVSGYRDENTRRRADQSGRVVSSSLSTGLSIYWVVEVTGSRGVFFFLALWVVEDVQICSKGCLSQETRCQN